MPLDTAGLQPALLDFFENIMDLVVTDGAGALDQAATNQAIGQRWGSVMGSYAAQILPPSTTVSTAASQLAADMASAVASPAAAAEAEVAFAKFAAAVGLGMAPGFTAIPPPGPVGFVAQMLIPQPTHAGAATAFAGLIDGWMKSGKATPSGGGPDVDWE